MNNDYFCEFDELRTNVWGHFCLCYDGRKLVNDKTHIRDFRMKDGDEVCDSFSCSME